MAARAEKGRRLALRQSRFTIYPIGGRERGRGTSRPRRRGARDVLRGPFGIELPPTTGSTRRWRRSLGRGGGDPDGAGCRRSRARSASSRTSGPSTTGWRPASRQADEVWIKIHKVGSGLPSITAKEAIDVVLCWGWIDGIRKGFDDKSFLQRYTPRGRKSVWSQINVDNVARLIEAGLMTAHGLKPGRRGQGRRPLGPRPMAAARTCRSRTTCRPRSTPSPRPPEMLGKLTDAEPLRARLPHPQHQDRGGPEEEDRQAFVEMLQSAARRSTRRGRAK